METAPPPIISDSSIVQEVYTEQPRDIVPSLEKYLVSEEIPPTEMVEALITRVARVNALLRELRDPIPDSAVPFLPDKITLVEEPDEKSARTLETYVFPLLSKLPAQEQVEVFQWMMPFLANISSIKIAEGPFLSQAVEFIKHSPNSQPLASVVLNHIYDNREKYHYRFIRELETTYTSSEISDIDSIVESVTHRMTPICIEALASETNEEKIKKTLGILVDRDYLANVTSDVRNVLRQGKGLTELQKRNLNRMGKRLIGISPDDSRTFFSSLEDLYAQVDFSHYETNKEATAREVSLFLDVIKKQGLHGGKIIDLGCGTGRITNELIKDEDISTVIGIDPSVDNLREAAVADQTRAVIYKEGTFEKNDIAPQSADVVISTGRTLTHLPRDKFKKGFKQVSTMLKPGGIFIFDLPDPNEGIYLENRKRYINILRDLDVPIPYPDEDLLSHFPHVVDSPDKGRSLFDRYTPDLDEILFEGMNKTMDYKTVLGMQTGFVIQEIGRAPIKGWRDAVNIYYVAKKVA